MRRRMQKSAAPASSAALAERFEKATGPVPGVLTVEAVEVEYMPELGKSGLPPSLEPDVPAEYRYWLMKDAKRAREVRDALVEASLFTSETVLKVSGELRRVVKQTKLFLVEEDAPGPETQYVQQVPANLLAARCLVETDKVVKVYDAATSPKLEELGKVAEDAGPWIGVYQDEPVAKTALQAAQLASIFKVRTRPGQLFASNVELSPLASMAEPVQPVEKMRQVRVVKAKKASAAEERFVYGVVLEPETKDLQGDVSSAEEIRKTAHGFMEDYRAGNYVAHQHDGKDITGQILVLESFLAPVDFEVEGPAGPEMVKKGTWMMGSRIVDDGLWESVQKGDITGYSIGGDAIRRPEKPANG